MGARKSPEVLELVGAYENDPSRRRTAAPKSESPIGSCPKYFLDDEKKCWYELLEFSAKGLLFSSDRWIAEQACKLMAKSRRDELNASELTSLIVCIGKLGMSPVDRMKLTTVVGNAGKKKEETAYDEFAPVKARA